MTAIEPDEKPDRPTCDGCFLPIKGRIQWVLVDKKWTPFHPQTLDADGVRWHNTCPNR